MFEEVYFMLDGFKFDVLVLVVFRYFDNFSSSWKDCFMLIEIVQEVFLVFIDNYCIFVEIDFCIVVYSVIVGWSFV